MKKLRFPLTFAIATFIIASCDITLPSQPTSSTSSSTMSSGISSSPSSSMPSMDFSTPPPVPLLTHPIGTCDTNSTPRISLNTEEEYDLFFHPTTMVMIDFQITKDNLALMNTYGNNTEDHDRYVNASIRLDVTPKNAPVISYCYPVVGVRLKGNTSRTEFVESSGAIKNFFNLKVSFATDDLLDGRVPNAQFIGMTRMDLKWNRNFDHTHMRQVFAHKLYAHYLPFAQQATLGGVRIIQSGVAEEYQDNYLGIYTITEPMDRRFFVRRLGNSLEADGNLYKVLYSATGAADFTRFDAVSSDGSNHLKTGNKIGIEDNPANYHPSYDLKTNTTVANFTDIVNLIGELNRSFNANASEYRARVEDLIDMPTFLMMEAIAYFIGNPDDYRNNANNLYLYFLPSTGKAYPIPYDLDRGLGSNGDWDPTVDPYSQFGPSMTKATPYQDALLKDWNQGRLNPLHRLTIYQGSYSGYRQTFTTNLETIYQSGWLTSQPAEPGNYTGLFYSMHQLYRSMYYPQGGQFLYLQPTAPTLSDIFVPFSLNQKTMLNLTYHEYISAKMNTYLDAIS